VTLPAILRVEDVMARYGMRDARTARRLMNEAGAFKAAGRLAVREDDLDAHERRLGAPRKSERLPPRTSPASGQLTHRTAPLSPASGPHWWREGLPSERAAE
jgi:hypothetical protein